MISAPAIAALALTAVVSYGLYELKYEVQGLERHYTNLSRELLEEQDSVHVLKAEWSYLSRPHRMQKLSDRFLPLRQTAPSQFVQLRDLPLRQVAASPEWVLPVPRHRPVSGKPVPAMPNVEKMTVKASYAAQANNRGVQP